MSEALIPFFIASKPDRRWYHVIVWWEVRRLPYNVILYVIGLLSFYIAFVTIPLVYIVIAAMLNIGYSFCYFAELIVRGRLDENTKAKYPRIAFFSYVALSALFILGIAFVLLLR